MGTQAPVQAQPGHAGTQGEGADLLRIQEKLEFSFAVKSLVVFKHWAFIYPEGKIKPVTLKARKDTPHHVVIDLHQGRGHVEAAQVRVLQALGLLYVVSKEGLSGMRRESEQRMQVRDQTSRHARWTPVMPATPRPPSIYCELPQAGARGAPRGGL